MSGGGFAPLPAPPYYAVIFANRRGDADDAGYGAMADAMVDRAAAQPGYLGIESTRGADGFGITVSYWASLEAIAAWKADASHLAAQRLGKERWYDGFALRIAKVERAYGWQRPDGSG